MKLHIIPKIQRLHHWSLGIDKLFHLILFLAYGYLSSAGCKLIYVSKSGPETLPTLCPSDYQGEVNTQNYGLVDTTWYQFTNQLLALSTKYHDKDMVGWRISSLSSTRNDFH